MSPHPLGAATAHCTANARLAKQRLAVILPALSFAIAVVHAHALVLGRLPEYSKDSVANDTDTTDADIREASNGSCDAKGGYERLTKPMTCSCLSPKPLASYAAAYWFSSSAFLIAQYTH